MVRPALASMLAMALASCSQSEGSPLTRIEMDGARPSPVVLSSPDTKDAIWQHAANPHALKFGTQGKTALLGLSCAEDTQGQPQLRIIRYAPAEPRVTAMMALIGNGRIARVKAAATSDKSGWHWEAILPAEAEDLDVFAGAGGVETTLPGAGTFTTARSDLPGQLLKVCRANAQPG